MDFSSKTSKFKGHTKSPGLNSDFHNVIAHDYDYIHSDNDEDDGQKILLI